MSVSDGSFEKERQIEIGNLSPEVLETPRQRYKVVSDGVTLLDEVIEVVFNVEKAA